MYKKVVLISLPKQDIIRPPGALPILAAACEELNVEYEIRDFNIWLYNNTDIATWHLINDNWDGVNPQHAHDTDFYQTFLQKLNIFVNLVLNDQPDLIAISVFANNGAVPAIELIKCLNDRPDRSKFDIIIGGTGIRANIPEFNNEELCTALLNKNLIDYYLFGEGEVSFRKLLNKEVAYQGINNFDTVQLDDLDQFPFPSYNKINPKDYNYITYPEVIVSGSRGCIKNCTYCDVAKYWPNYRYRSGKKIADELYHYYKKTGINHFEFSDSLINGSLKQFRDMNSSLIEYQKLDPEFKPSFKGQYICRAKTSIKENDYIEMKKAGCNYLYVGVESFSNKVRFDMAKKFTNEDLEFHLQMCGKYGIANSFLMLVGYPTETLDDHQQNVDTLKKYQKYAQAGIIEMIVFGYTTSILEDTPLYHMQHELNIVPEFHENKHLGGTNWVSLDNPTLDLKERIRRWVELVELAAKLGYRMPRNRHYITRFISLLENTDGRKITYKIENKK